MFFRKHYPSHSHPFKLPSVVRRLQCFPHWQLSKISTPPHTPPKAQLRLLRLGSFLLRENYHPIEFRFQALLIMPKRLNTIGLFRKPPRAWMHYDMSQVQCKTFPFPRKTGFWINGHPSILRARKKQGLKTRTEVVTVCGPAGCAVSSVGRALPRHGRGHWFKSSTAHHFPIFLRFL